MATAVMLQQSPGLTVSSAWQSQVSVNAHASVLNNIPGHEKENEEDQSLEKDGKNKPKVEPISELQRFSFLELIKEYGFGIYPTRDEKEKLAGILNLSYAQVTRLFANHRRKVLKKKTTPVNNEDDSIEKLLTMIKDPSILDDNLVNDDTSTSERSLSPVVKSNGSIISRTQDSSFSICGFIADQIHDDIENKQILTSESKKKPRTIKRKAANERDAHLEATVEEILSKVSRRDIDVEKKGKGEINKKQELMSATVGVASNITEPETSNLLSLVNEAITKPPLPLPDSIMADVNPKLLEAMDLLNKGVSFTHPTILSVLLQILNRQKEEREQMLLMEVQKNQNQTFHPASDFVDSQYSEKSTDEVMRSLTPDEYLAVSVLAELSNS